MANPYDLFYAANDDEVTDDAYLAANPTASVTVAAEGNLWPITPGTATLYPLGSNVKVSESAKPTWYARVTKIPDADNLYLVPIQSASDSASPLGTTYTTSATVANESQTHCVLVIDLTDAPESAYNYAILASAALSDSGTSYQARGILRSMALVGDDYSGDGVNPCVVTCSNGSHVDRYSYNAVKLVTLDGGQRYEFALRVRAESGGAHTSRMSNGRIVAIRYDRAYSTGDGMTGSDTTTTSKTVASVTTDEGGPFLVVCAASVGCTAGTVALTLSTSFPGSDPYQINLAATTPANSNDDISVGGAAISEANDVYSLILTASGGTARLKNWMLAVIPLKALYVAEGLGSYRTNGAGNTAAQYVTNVTSESKTLTAGYHLELASFGCSKAGDTRYAVRANWQAPDFPFPTDRGHFSNARPIHAFTFVRAYRRAGSATNLIDSHSVTGTTAPSVPQAQFAWLRENPAVVPVETTPRTIVAEIETGIVKRKWTQVSGDLWKTTLSDVEWVSRVLVNGSEYTRLTYQPTASGQWAFNPEPSTDVEINTTTTALHASSLSGTSVTVSSGTGFRVGRRVRVKDGSKVYFADITAGSGTTWTFTPRVEPGDYGYPTNYANGSTVKAMPGKALYVYMPSGKTPNDADYRVVVCAQVNVGRTKEDITQADKYTLPYEPRLKGAPSVSQSLDVSGREIRATTQYGDLVIVAPDRAYDATITQRILEGVYAKVLRGFSTLSTNRASFDVIADAVLGIPELTADELRLNLFNRAIALSGPVSVSYVSVYQGSATRDRQALPVIYGTVKRVPAYRITHQTGSGNSNTYKVSFHALKDITNIYASPSIETSSTATSEDATNGQFTVINSNATLVADVNNPPDVLYADVQGYASGGVLIDTPGAIAEHLLTNFPVAPDGAAGFSTTISGTHTQPTSGTVTVTVASGTGIFVGARVKVSGTVGGVASSYFAQVTVVSGTSITFIWIAEPGDSDGGSSYATSATFAEQRPAARGLATKSLARASFRLMDRAWRMKARNGTIISSAVQVGLYLAAGESVADALDELCRSVFAYWRINRAGRIQLGVLDYDKQSLSINPGIEYDKVSSTRSSWPWLARGLGTLATVTNAAFEGAQSATITASRDAASCARQTLVIPRGGYLVASGPVALSSGSTTGACVGVIAPDCGCTEQLGDGVSLSASVAWSRSSCVAIVDPVGSGTTQLSVYPSNRADSALPYQDTASVWLEASYMTSHVDADALSANWANRGTLGGTFSQGTSTKRPSWRRGVLGRKASIRFDGGDVLAASGGSIALSTAQTICVVFKANGLGDGYLLGDGTSNYVRYKHSGTVLEYAAGGTIASVSQTLANDTWYMLTIRRSGTTVRFFLDGTQVGANQTLGANSNFSTQYMAASNTTPSDAFTGDIALALIWPTDIGATNQAVVQDYVRRRYGLETATVRFDSIECTPVVAVLDDNNSDLIAVSFRTEDYHSVVCGHSVNVSDPSRLSSVIVTPNEGYALTPLTYSEARDIVASSGRLDLGTPLLAGSSDAVGVAAAAAAYFGRQRHVLRIEALGLISMPQVGECIYVSHSRVPDGPDGRKVWQITGVQLTDNAQVIVLEAERQADPILDRTLL